MCKKKKYTHGNALKNTTYTRMRSGCSSMHCRECISYFTQGEEILSFQKKFFKHVDRISSKLLNRLKRKLYHQCTLTKKVSHKILVRIGANFLKFIKVVKTPKTFLNRFKIVWSRQFLCWSCGITKRARISWYLSLVTVQVCGTLWLIFYKMVQWWTLL